MLNRPNGLRLLAVSALILISFQSACGKKTRAVMAPAEPAKVAFLPLNVSGDQEDIRWVALAAPVLMAQVCERAPDLTAIPLWESMPVAVDSAGASRIFTDASAEAAASWLSAQWGAMGEVSPAKRERISFIVDFIPVRGKQIPFRYMKTGRPDTISEGLPNAFTQFLRYLTARPLEKTREANPKMTSMKWVAEALDLEYGWFVEAQPGKAQETIERLMSEDKEDLARFLFSPKTYPQLQIDN
jgi:hypothetical protein